MELHLFRFLPKNMLKVVKLVQRTFFISLNCLFQDIKKNCFKKNLISSRRVGRFKTVILSRFRPRIGVLAFFTNLYRLNLFIKRFWRKCILQLLFDLAESANLEFLIPLKNREIRSSRTMC